MITPAGPDEYRLSVESILGADEVDALIVIYTPVDQDGSQTTLSGITDGIAAGRRSGAATKPVLACLMGEAGRPQPLHAGAERIPAYAFPENAARALGKAASYGAWRRQTPGLFWSFNDIRASEARTMCRDIVEHRGEDWLTDDELLRLTSAFGLPMTPAVLARDADQAAGVAVKIGFPVAVKLSSRGLLPKSDSEAVRLKLASADAVRAAFAELTAIGTARGLAAPLAVVVQPMIGNGTEVIVGIADDPLFGPLVGVGLGGVNVEPLGDIQFRIAPLTDRDADEMLHEMRGFSLLDGYRGRPRGDVDALAELVLRVSRLAEEIPEIVALDFNPVIVLAAGQGCRIVGARVKVGRRT
jgi:acyl-CoA synthetase (NDP forming)